MCVCLSNIVVWPGGWLDSYSVPISILTFIRMKVEMGKGLGYEASRPQGLDSMAKWEVIYSLPSFFPGPLGLLALFNFED